MAKTFRLEFDIESDCSHNDIALALKRVAASIDRTVGEMEGGDSAPIRNHAGKKIGEWSVDEGG